MSDNNPSKSISEIDPKTIKITQQTTSGEEPLPEASTTPPPDDEVISMLAAMTPLEYERARAEYAKQMGCRPAVLDGLVKAARQQDDASGSLPFPKVVPCPDPVESGLLLDEVSVTIRRFIVMDEEQADAAALWVALTWFIDVVEVAPLAIINGPEKACGKSLLLDVMGRMTPRTAEPARGSHQCQPGKGNVFLRYKLAGRTKYIKIGRTYEISLADAKKKALQLKAEITTGGDPRQDKKDMQAVPTLTAFVEDYYFPYVRHRKRTAYKDEELFRLPLKKVFGDLKLNQITRHQIQAFHTAVREEGLAPASGDHYLKLLRHSLNLAVG